MILWLREPHVHFSQATSFAGGGSDGLGLARGGGVGARHLHWDLMVGEIREKEREGEKEREIEDEDKEGEGDFQLLASVVCCLVSAVWLLASGF